MRIKVIAANLHKLSPTGIEVRLFVQEYCRSCGTPTELIKPSSIEGFSSSTGQAQYSVNARCPNKRFWNKHYEGMIPLLTKKEVENIFKKTTKQS